MYQRLKCKMQDHKTLRRKPRCPWVIVVTFLDITPKAQSIKEIVDNLELIKIKNFYAEKKCCQENEKTSHRLEKVFAKDTSDK